MGGAKQEFNGIQFSWRAAIIDVYLRLSETVFGSSSLRSLHSALGGLQGDVQPCTKFDFARAQAR